MKPWIFVAVALAGCVSWTQTQKNDWLTFKASPEYARDVDTFIERMGGAKRPCMAKSVADFLEGSPEADSTCIYVSGPMKVMQVLPDGFLVSYPGAKLRVFIRKTDEQGLVDGSVINNGDVMNFYVYSGPMTYKTILGSRTVHTFTKVTAAVVEAQKGLKNYSLIEEAYAERGLWQEALPHKRRKPQTP